MHCELAVQAVPWLAELALQVPETVGQLLAVQGNPERLQVPVPVAGQLALLVHEAPETLQVPGTVGQLALVVHDVPVWMLHLPPTMAQLLGDVVHAAPPDVPPQRLVVAQVPLDVQSAPVMLQVRPVLEQAVDEQSAPVTLHFFCVEHCAAEVHDVPVLLQVPARVGQLVAALAAVQDAPLTLHAPMSVQTEALFVQSTLEMLHFLPHCWTSLQLTDSGSASRLQPAGCQTFVQVELSTLQDCAATLQVWVLTLLQVWLVVLQVCAVPALQVCATGLHAGWEPTQVWLWTPLQTWLVSPLQVCAEAPEHPGVGAAGQVPVVTPVQEPAISPLQVGLGGRLQVCVPTTAPPGQAALLVLHQITLSFW